MVTTFKYTQPESQDIMRGHLVKTQLGVMGRVVDILDWFPIKVEVIDGSMFHEPGELIECKPEQLQKYTINLPFYTERTVTTTVRDKITYEQFREMLNRYKPDSLYNYKYSSKFPCWYITEYVDAEHLNMYADNWADKTPVTTTIFAFYNTLCINGIDETFITI